MQELYTVQNSIVPEITLPVYSEDKSKTNGIIERIKDVFLEVLKKIKNFCSDHPVLIFSAIALILCGGIMAFQHQPVNEIISTAFKLLLIPALKEIIKIGRISFGTKQTGHGFLPANESLLSANKPLLKKEKFIRHENVPFPSISFSQGAFKLTAFLPINPLTTENEIKEFLENEIQDFTFQSYESCLYYYKNSLEDIKNIIMKFTIDADITIGEKPLLLIIIDCPFNFTDSRESLQNIINTAKKKSLMRFKGYKTGQAQSLKV